MRKLIITIIAAGALAVPATAGATKTCTRGSIYGLHGETLVGSIRANNLTCNQANYAISHGWLFGKTPYMYVSTRGYSCKVLKQYVPPGDVITTGQNIKCVSRTNSARWFRFGWAT